MVQEITKTSLYCIIGLVGIVYVFKASDWVDDWLIRITLIGLELLLVLKLVALVVPPSLFE